ncbi:MAG: SdrD B-like domain-containing protein [Acidobacteriota bacterium]
MLSRTKMSTFAMRSGLVLALALLLAPIGAMGQAGIGPFAYFPTGDVTDGRMLSFGCNANATFVETVNVSVAVPADQPNFSISFFDGDTGSVWDSGTRELSFDLFFDPQAEGSTDPANLVASWKGNSVNPISSTSDPDRTWVADATMMPDNDWFNIDVTSSPLAAAPSGVRFYNLRIVADECDPGESLNSNLKLAASAPLTFVTARFGFQAVLINAAAEGPIIYPDWPPTSPTFFVDSPTTYDGSFRFFVNLPQNFTQLSIRDGDFDFGTNPAQLTGLPAGVALTPCVDTDDADTPADYAGIDLGESGANANLEGATAFGEPSDDSQLDSFRRGEPGSTDNVGCVRYQVTDPDGVTYRNDNPSGSFEWERFRIAGSAASDPANADYGPTVAADGSTFVNTATLPPGVWTVDIFGLDLSNLNFWVMDREICATRSDTPACNPPAFLVGDTVYFDTNGNGVQDADEPGIDGVTVELYLDPAAPAILTTTTGDNSGEAAQLYQTVTGNTDFTGKYAFGVPSTGVYTAVVAASNFLPGGALENLASTTGGDSISGDLDGSDNLFTLDFGYRGTASIGNSVWFDADNDGIENDGSDAGIGGVTVNLTGAGDDGVIPSGDDVDFGSQVTAADGSYLFEGLLAGSYRVDVDDSTVPAGLALTTNNDPLDVTIAAGDAFLDADFGYIGTASIGDRVWNDDNGDGVQDAGETGIDGLTVTLLDAGGSPVAVTTTGPDGFYSFNNLAGGDYTVTVDASPLAAGTVPTFDVDGIGTANTATVTLAPGENRDDVDFGYNTPVAGLGSLGDRVWWDTNSDGIQDAGELGLNGVTVALLDSNGDVLATDTTAGDGNYLFTDLEAGAYTVIVDFVTLPSGFEATGDLDGLLTLNAASVAIAGSSDVLDVDFGYNATEAKWCAEETRSQAPYHGGNDEHAVWLPGIDRHLLFEKTSFTQLPDGTARLVGTAFSRDVANVGFAVDVTFTGRTTTAPSGSPKKELQSSAYVQNGGPVDTDTWTYYTGFSGTLSGTGDWAGASLAIDRVGPAFQLGFGANGKSVDLGGSGWFTWQVTSQPTSGGALKTTGQGDFNVDFGRCATYCAEAAYRGPFAQSNYDHAMYLPIVGKDFEYVPDFGTFRENLDGTATMTGLLQRRGDAGAQFRVDVTYSGRTSIPGEGSPYLKMTSNAYAVNGGPVNPSGWYYYTEMSGTLTGEGDLAGAVLSLSRRGPAFQVGEGANEKNVNFGGSGWFNWTLVSQPTNGPHFPNSGNGDFNQDFGTCPKGPAPICPVGIDWNVDANGAPTHAGQIIDDEYSAFGITITSSRSNKPPMIFDSSNPTGGDPDLGTPNQDFGGPGVGSGGGAGEAGENSQALGHLLIISEDGDSSDPDDNAGGGTLTFDFANPVDVTSVTVVDIDSNESSGTIRTFDAIGQLLTTSPMVNLGGNSVQAVSVGATGVSSMEIEFPKSGGVGPISLCATTPPGDDDDDDDNPPPPPGDDDDDDDNPPPPPGDDDDDDDNPPPPGDDDDDDDNPPPPPGDDDDDDDTPPPPPGDDDDDTPPPPPGDDDDDDTPPPPPGDDDDDTGDDDNPPPPPGGGGDTPPPPPGGGGDTPPPPPGGGGDTPPPPPGGGGDTPPPPPGGGDTPPGDTGDNDNPPAPPADPGFQGPPANVGTSGLSFWRNHEQHWPAATVNVGGVEYASADAITTFRMNPQGDQTYVLYRNLATAKLNIAHGNDDSCVAAAIATADAWLVQNPLGSNVRGNTNTWKDSARAANRTLVDYNKGELCAPRRVGTKGWGYFKNADRWPVANVTVGGTSYDTAGGVQMLKASAGGDQTYVMYRELVGARLNAERGTDASCIADTLAAADLWLTRHAVGSNVRGRDGAWRDEGNPLRLSLREYNRGELCSLPNP